MDLGDSIHPLTPGESVVLQLPDASTGLRVRIGTRTVTAARETAIQKFIYTPRLWASSLASVMVLVLLGFSLTTGSIRPAPPPAPTPAPGEPTPTPDTRPIVSLPFVQLVGPPPLPTTTPQARIVVRDEAVAQPTEDPEPEHPATTGCSNFLGLGCGNNPPAPPRIQPAPARPAPPRPAQQQGQDQAQTPQVIPLPSPAAVGGPPPGSNLDMALRVASLESDQFNRSLEDTSGTGK